MYWEFFGVLDEGLSLEKLVNWNYSNYDENHCLENFKSKIIERYQTQPKNFINR